MDKKEIFEILEENDLDNIEEINKGKECVIFRFSYIFDVLELEGATEYAKDEFGEVKNELWYEEYFLPYLNDTAIDNVNDIIDEISEDFDLDYEMLSFELSQEEYEEMKFIVAFYRESLPVDIDELIMEL